MRMAFRFVSVVASIVAVNLADAIPTNGSGENNESDIHQVVVDVVVTDSNHQPVKGLRELDFRVFEGNKLQQIRSFEAHDQQAATQASQPTRLAENTFSNVGASETGSINVILLDQVTTSREDQKLAKRELIAYLEQKPPETRFAIFTYRNRDTFCISCTALRMLQGITADKELLIGALEERGARPQEPALRVLVGWEIEDTSMHALAEIGNFLKELPGRKELIWMSDNFDAAPVAERGDIWFPPKFKGWENVNPLSKEQTLHLAASRLAIARVAVYPIDLNGRNKTIESKRLCPESSAINWLVGINLYGQSEEDPRFYECTGAKGIRVDSMAGKSGGQAFHRQSEIQEAIAQAVAEGENYYTLSYSATNKFNGKLRTIRVAINQKEYHVRFRQRYFADDPSTVYRPGTEPSPDIVLPGTTRSNPWKIGRVSVLASSEPEGPIGEGMRYGGPELNGLIFQAQVTANGKPMKATQEQLNQLGKYESFLDESAEQFMRNPTKEVLKTQHHGQILLSVSPPDQLYLQGFSIEYAIAANQLGLTTAADGKLRANLEIAVLAFDESGKRVNGIKDTMSFAVHADKLQGLQASGYRMQQTFDVPERATVLRIAMRDVSRNKVGSVEIPIWAISNPYQRRRLEIPVVAEDGKREKKSRHAP